MSDDPRKSSLSKPGRTEKENVVKRLLPFLCGFYIDLQVFLYLFLPDIIRKVLWPKRHLGLHILGLY